MANNPKVYSGGRVLLVDPNPDNNVIVTPEDLSISVSLETVQRERSSISVIKNVEAVVNEGSQNPVRVSFINGSNIGGGRALTTHYTEVNTKFSKDNPDLETFGITNIQIDFNSSYAPIVVIDFTDIRGRLFELGENSPYSVFFNLPYPIFKLSVKGYFGKEVTYCLHLTKFNGKLNDRTGNFEITCHFIGYTYAFLTDILLGYARAIPYTNCGLNKIQELKRTNPNFYTFDEVLSAVKSINTEIAKLKLTDDKLSALSYAEDVAFDFDTLRGEIRSQLNKLTRASTDSSKVGDTLFVGGDWFYIIKKPLNDKDNASLQGQIEKFNSSVKTDINTIQNKEGFSDKYKLVNDLYFLKTSEPRTIFNDVTKGQFSGDSQEYLANGGYAEFAEDEVRYEKVKSRIRSLNVANDLPLTIYDLTEANSDLTAKLKLIRDDAKATRETVAEQVSKKVKEILKFEPSIGNFFKILADHVDILIECIREVSVEAEKDPFLRKEQLKEVFNNLDKIIGADNGGENIKAWPDYREKDEKSDGAFVDKWIGNKAPTMPEVIFIEELLDGLLKAKEQDNQFLNALENPINIWFPVNPLDVPLVGAEVAGVGGFSNPWISVKGGTTKDVIRLMAQRAIIFMNITANDVTENEIKAMARIEANNAYTYLERDVARALSNFGGGGISENVEAIINTLINGDEEFRNFAYELNKDRMIINHTTKYKFGSDPTGYAFVDNIIDGAIDLGLDIVSNIAGYFGADIPGSELRDITINQYEYVYIPWVDVDSVDQIDDLTKKKVFNTEVSFKPELSSYIPLFNPNNDLKLYDGGYLVVKSDGKTLLSNADRRKLREDSGAIFFSNMIGGNASGPVEDRHDEGETFIKIFRKNDYIKFANASVYPEYIEKILQEEGFTEVSNIFDLTDSDIVDSGVPLSKFNSPFGGALRTHEAITCRIDPSYLGGIEEVPSWLVFYANTTGTRPAIGTRRRRDNNSKIVTSPRDLVRLPNGNITLKGLENINLNDPIQANNAIALIGGLNNLSISQSSKTELRNLRDDKTFGNNMKGLYEFYNGDTSTPAIPYVNFKLISQFSLTDEEISATFSRATLFSLFGSPLYYNQKTERAKAYLFLHSIPFNGTVYNFNEGTLGTRGNPFVQSNRGNGILTKNAGILFNTRGAWVEAPYSWILFMGALLWRHFDLFHDDGDVQFEWDISGEDTINWYYSEGNIEYSLVPLNGTINAGTGVIPKPYEYILPNITTNEGMSFQIQLGVITGEINIFGSSVDIIPGEIDPIAGGDANDFVPLERAMTSLPTSIMKEFVREFKEWVDSPTGWANIRDNFEIFSKDAKYDDIIDLWLTYEERVEADPNEYYSDPAFNPKIVDNYFIVARDIVCTEVPYFFNEYPDDFDDGMDALFQLLNSAGNLSTKSARVAKAKLYVNVWDLGDPFYFFTEVRDESPAAKAYFDFLLQTRMIANASWRPWKANVDADDRVDGVRHPFRVLKSKFDLYVESFVQEFKNLLNGEDTFEKENQIKRELFGTINNDDIKLNLYKNIKSIYDKWVAGSDNILQLCGQGNGKLIDNFRFVDRAYRDISQTFIVNPIAMMEYMVSDYNQSFYDYTARALVDNNFDFIPLPTFINYNNPDEIASVFKTYSYNDKPQSSGPLFVCMYIGERSSKLDLGGQSKYENDGFDFRLTTDGSGIDLNGLPSDLSGENTATENDKRNDNRQPYEQVKATSTISSGLAAINSRIGISEGLIRAGKSVNGGSKPLNDGIVPVFLVQYGDQNQGIFTNFRLDQSEFKETDESLQIIDSIASKGSPNNTDGLGQNLFDIYNNRSYSAEIEMLGDAMIQPLMYFQLSSIPMFHGAYTIIKVSHSIKPNHMTTKFQGVRIRKVRTPLVDESTVFMNLIGSLTDVTFEGSDLNNLTDGSIESGGISDVSLKVGSGGSNNRVVGRNGTGDVSLTIGSGGSNIRVVGRNGTGYNSTAGNAAIIASCGGCTKNSFCCGCGRPSPIFKDLPFYQKGADPSPNVVSSQVSEKDLIDGIKKLDINVIEKRITYAVVMSEQFTGKNVTAFGNNMFGYNVEGNFNGMEELVRDGKIVHTFCWHDAESPRVFPQFSSFEDSLFLFANNQAKRWTSASWFDKSSAWNDIITANRFNSVDKKIKVTDSRELQIHKAVVLYYFLWNSPRFKVDLINKIGPVTKPNYGRYTNGGSVRTPINFVKHYEKAISLFSL